MRGLWPRAPRTSCAALGGVCVPESPVLSAVITGPCCWCAHLLLRRDGPVPPRPRRPPRAGVWRGEDPCFPVRAHREPDTLPWSAPLWVVRARGEGKGWGDGVRSRCCFLQFPPVPYAMDVPKRPVSPQRGPGGRCWRRGARRVRVSARTSSPASAPRPRRGMSLSRAVRMGGASFPLLLH